MFKRPATGARVSSCQIEPAGFAAVFIAVIVWSAPLHAEELHFTKFIGKERFAVPKQYLHPRPNGNQGDKCPTCAFGIQFWIPDLSAPENDLFFRPEFRPPEANRPSPTAGEFVVKAASITYVDPLKLDIDTAETRIASMLDRYDGDKILSEQFGELTRVFSKSAPDGPQRFYVRRSEGSIFLFCAGNQKKQICQGFADIPEYEITSRFHFPISEIHNYALMVEGISVLLGKWKAK